MSGEESARCTETLGMAKNGHDENEVENHNATQGMDDDEATAQTFQSKAELKEKLKQEDIRLPLSSSCDAEGEKEVLECDDGYDMLTESNM